MTGWDVLAELLRHFGNEIPAVVVVSAHDLPQTLFGSGQEVFDVTMHRPLSQQELPELLKSVLREVRPKFPPNEDLEEEMISAGDP